MARNDATKKAEREAAAKAEQEAADREAAAKAEQEAAGKEAAAKAEQEAAGKEAAAKAEQEAADKEAAAKAEPVEVQIREYEQVAAGVGVKRVPGRDLLRGAMVPDLTPGGLLRALEAGRAEIVDLDAAEADGMASLTIREYTQHAVGLQVEKTPGRELFRGEIVVDVTAAGIAALMEAGKAEIVDLDAAGGD